MASSANITPADPVDLTNPTPDAPANLHADDKVALDAFYAGIDRLNYSAYNSLRKELHDNVCPKMIPRIRDLQIHHGLHDNTPMPDVEHALWDSQVDAIMIFWLKEPKTAANRPALSVREQAKQLYEYRWRLRVWATTKGSMPHFVDEYMRGKRMPGRKRDTAPQHVVGPAPQ